MAEAARTSGCAACRSPSKHPDVAGPAATCEPLPSIAQPSFPVLPSAPRPKMARGNLAGHADADLTARHAKGICPLSEGWQPVRRNQSTRKTSGYNSEDRLLKRKSPYLGTHAA